MQRLLALRAVRVSGRVLLGRGVAPVVPLVRSAPWFVTNRPFSSTQSVQAFRPPKTGILGIIPDSVKVFGLALGVGSVVVFVALPVAILVVPPVLVGGWFVARSMIRRRKREMDAIMEKLETAQLRYKDDEAELEIGDTHLARFALQRFTLALQDNEGGVDDDFQLGTETYRLALGPIEYHNQEWKFMDSAYALVGLEKRPIMDKNTEQRVGTLAIATLSNPVHNPLEAIMADYRVVIEATPAGRLSHTYTIDTPKEILDMDDDIIDVKGRTRDQ